MRNRPDYRLTKITIEVLSLGEYGPASVEQVAYDMTDGSCPGSFSIGDSKKLNKKRAIKFLKDVGSDESFLEFLGNAGE